MGLFGRPSQADLDIYRRKVKLFRYIPHRLALSTIVRDIESPELDLSVPFLAGLTHVKSPALSLSCPREVAELSTPCVRHQVDLSLTGSLCNVDDLRFPLWH